ncbi:B12-binding domain-containing radical SAM protein [Myxococcota bacterium]|nr:B12-binding domain-containing radical SAM protein [Myxococcota bacterium]
MHVVFASVGYGELLGVELLSALLRRAGHRTSLAYDPALFDDRFALHLPRLARAFDRLDRVVDQVLDLRPDLLALSAMTPTYGWARGLATRVRARRHIPTVIGGTHASAVPAHVLSDPAFDWACQGEGEGALLALVEDLARGGGGEGIANLWRRSEGGPVPPPCQAPFVADLDALPFPDKSLYGPHLPRRGMYGIMTSRGCPYACTFCFNSQFRDTSADGARGYLRRRSVDGVLAELCHAAVHHPFRYVEFHDDIFTTDRRWLRDFAQRYREQVGAPFGCSSHARFLDDERVALLQQAGCVRVKLGVQSLDAPEYRRTVLKRTDTELQIAQAIDTCRRRGLRIEVDQIVGLPGEAPQARQRALDFYRAHPPDRIGAYRYTWFPGTELTERALHTGQLRQATWRRILDGDTSGYFQADPRSPASARDQALDHGYAAALDLLPKTPTALRARLSPEALARHPALAAAARWIMGAGMLVDVVGGGGQDALAYVRWYGKQLGIPDPSGW